MFDFEEESDEDTESQLKDLQQLNAVLEADEISSCAASKFSDSAISSLPSSTKIEEYSKIETALALNKLTDDKLVRLEKILIERLRECRQKLSEYQGFDKSNDKFDKRETFRYINCGKPYFQDRDGFPAPDNDDTLLMAKSGMYDFSCIASVPGWTVKDKSEFIELIHIMSKEIRRKQVYSQIAQLNREMKTDVMKKEKEKEVASLQVQLNSINKRPLKDLALPVNEEYDWDTLANKLNHRHNAQEYRALWKLFLHPSINKNCWTKREHQNLQKIAHRYNMHDWDKIAEELDTKRTGYQCFVYFRTNMSNSFTSHKWTKEEEEYLKRLIEFYKEENYIPWGRVAASMENRTKMQIYNKYMRLTEYRKGRFLHEEDGVILNGVKTYGLNFDKIKEYLPGRSAAQIRNRYRVLKKTSLSTVWTVSEDKKLLQLMAHQDSSTNYSSLCKYLPGKDRVHIRARYVTLMKWMQRNPNVDISYAPRRGARRLCHGQAADNLNKAMEKLKNRMQAEVEEKKSKRLSIMSSEEDIDEAIVAFMVTESIKELEGKQPSLEQQQLKLFNDLVVSADALNTTNLKKILIMLKAKLHQNDFKKSIYCERFPELLNPEQEVCLVKVKSYSRKDVVNTIKVEKPADIWGGALTSPSEYVLPPHLATITACKMLIGHISKKSIGKVNENSLIRKNVIFKEHMFRLMERFSVLFLWPVLLSNEVPSKKKSNMVTSVSLGDDLGSIREGLTFEDSDDDMSDKGIGEKKSCVSIS